MNFVSTRGTFIRGYKVNIVWNVGPDTELLHWKIRVCKYFS